MLECYLLQFPQTASLSWGPDSGIPSSLSYRAIRKEAEKLFFPGTEGVVSMKKC